MPPANVMDRVGSKVWGNDTDVGDEVVVSGGEIGIGNACGMDKAAHAAAALLSVGCTPKEAEGDELDGANTC